MQVIYKDWNNLDIRAPMLTSDTPALMWKKIDVKQDVDFEFAKKINSSKWHASPQNKEYL